MLYNSVTKTFAKDGYYITEGVFRVTNGLAELIELGELSILCEGL
jgi:hypothetical protein